MTALTTRAASPTALDAATTALLALLRQRGPLTRAEMAAETGWARVTVTTRLEKLLQLGFLLVDEGGSGGRGRPAVRYGLNSMRGALLVADVGASGMRLALVDLDGRVEAATEHRVAIAHGPEEVLEVAHQGLRELAASVNDRPVWGVGISLPGPVDFAAGRVVTPPIMTGWDGVPVREIVRDWFDCPVLVDNDVNAMAVGEQATRVPSVSNMLVVKIGTGVGCGIISDGRVLRGGAGAAGDIGHTWADAGSRGDAPPDCRCGKRGCLEAYVGGWAIARDLSTQRREPIGVNDVVDLLRIGDPMTVRLVRDAGRVLGASLATAVSLLNPSAVVLSGQVAVAAGDHLLAGLRERIYTRALPLATRHLDICVSTMWPDSGVVGLARSIADVVMASA